MIDENVDKILSELGAGSYILVAKTNPDGNLCAIVRWNKLSEMMIVGLLEKTKHDMLADINKRQSMIGISGNGTD